MKMICLIGFAGLLFSLPAFGQCLTFNNPTTEWCVGDTPSATATFNCDIDPVPNVTYSCSWGDCANAVCTAGQYTITATESNTGATADVTVYVNGIDNVTADPTATMKDCTVTLTATMTPHDKADCVSWLGDVKTTPNPNGSLTASGDTSTKGSKTATALVGNQEGNCYSSCDATFTVVELAILNAASCPADQHRTTVGVGETTIISTDPSWTVSWTACGTAAGSGAVYNWTAPDRATTCAVVATLNGCNNTVTFTVVEPAGVSIVRTAGTGVWHVQNTSSVGFKGDPYITPADVSFANISIREGAVNAVATGFWAAYNGTPHAVGSWAGVACNANGNKVSGVDTIATAALPGPYSAGTFLWAIPWEFKVGAGAAKQFTTVNHTASVDASGSTTTAKGGHSETKAAAAASSGY